IAIDEHHQPRVDEQYQNMIRSWLSEHHTRLRDLYEYWFRNVATAELWREQWAFWRRVQNADPGDGHGRWLLEKAEAEPDDIRAAFLFREAVRTLTSGQGTGAPTLEELFASAEQQPRFGEALRAELSSEIPQWRLEEAERRREEDRRQAEARRSTV